MFHDFGRDRRDDRYRYDDEPGFEGRRAASEPGDGYERDLGRGDLRDDDRDGRGWREDPRYAEARSFDDDRGEAEARRDEERRRRGEYDFGRTDRRYSLNDTRRRLPREETERLIASDKVEGAPVYDLRGRRVGEVENFMVDKRSGQVEYAVIRVRGGLFSGQAYRPVDWMDLEYDERLDGYRVDVERRALRHDRDFERYR